MPVVLMDPHLFYPVSSGVEMGSGGMSGGLGVGLWKVYRVDGNVEVVGTE